MPYFIYKVFPGKNFELVGHFDAYREARDSARERRKTLTADDSYSVKVIFAENSEEAERLMAEEREARPMGEDA